MSSSFQHAWADVKGIEGWLTEGQARMLHDAASAVPSGEAIVEIGSHHGRSTVILAKAKRGEVPLVAVDPYVSARWGGGEAAQSIFEANLREQGVFERVRLERKYGAEAGRDWRDGPVGMLFVDGAHDYESVDADLDSWLPHLSPTAVVLMHDAFSSPGVTRVAFRRMFGRSDFSYCGSSRSLIAFRRGRPNLARRVLSSARMLSKLLWLVRNLAVKIAMRRGWQAIGLALGHSGPEMPY